MDFTTLPLGAIAANCTVLRGNAKKAWIVDPGGEPARLIAFLDAEGLTPTQVLLTHAHFDHIGAIPGLLARWPALPVHVGPGDAAMFGDPRNAWEPEYTATPRPATLVCDLTDGATLAADGFSACVIATPGHTSGGACLHFAADRLLFTGDTLFAGSVGRTDFPGGSFAELQASLAKLKALPGATRVVCGHGGGTTLAKEFARNPYLQ